MVFGLALARFCHPLCGHTHVCTADCIVVQQAPGSWGEMCVFVEYFPGLLSHTVAAAAQADG